MKVQCDLCKEIVVADFAVAGDGAIELVCPSCRGRFTVSATRNRRVTGELVVRGENQRVRRASMPVAGEPDMTCPKCGEVQRLGPACRTCGLGADRMAEFAREQEATVPPAVAERWQHAEAHWSDPDAHEQLMQAAAGTGAYPWVARRYRDVLRQRPDDPVAPDQIARLARMAEATLIASASQRQTAVAPYRGIGAVMLVLLAVIAAGIVYVMVARRGPPPPNRIPIAPSAPGSLRHGN